MGKPGRKPGKKLTRRPDPPSKTPPSEQRCDLTWMHIDHTWKDSAGISFRCPGIWPH